MPTLPAAVPQTDDQPAIAGTAAVVDDAGGSDGAPWPSEADETVFLTRAGGGISTTEPETALPEPQPALPSLEDAVARVPAPLRETLDELFRARFTSVRRLPDKFVPGGQGT